MSFSFPGNALSACSSRRHPSGAPLLGHSLLGALCVKIENMSFVESGGDGICLGRMAQDIVIRKCRYADNHRQGICVCSAKNLLIEDCVLINTRGPAPSAGIDFEPDHGRHRISNCVMRNCHIEGNACKGIDIFHKQKKTMFGFPMCDGMPKCRAVSYSGI